MIAALYVESNGVYANLPDVDVWDEARDARAYFGPYPVVAHPPCARWSRLAGFTESRFGLKRGADGGCFAAALWAVREFGGVLEHPAYSAAWDAFNLPEPAWVGGWNLAFDGGASCYVEQGRYGMPVKKATWLYTYGVPFEALPELRWGYEPDAQGRKSREPRDPRAIGGKSGAWQRTVEGMRSDGERSRTPVEFRDALLAIAGSAQVVEPAPA